MVKTVRVFLALFATLWYTTSPLNSNALIQLWEPPIVENTAAPNYYKPLEFDKVKFDDLQSTKLHWDPVRPGDSFCVATLVGEK